MGNIILSQSSVNLTNNCKECKKIPAYIISMTDMEYNNAQSRLLKFGLTNIKKFNAIRGDTLGNFVTDHKNVTIKGLYDIKLQNIRGAHAELTNINSIGCYLSHVELWKKVVKDNLPGMIIFESDCICNGDILNSLNEFLKVKDGDILYFGYFGPYINYTGLITKIYVRTFGLHAYYITNKCAKTLLKNAFPIEQQIDSYMSDMLLLSQEPNSVIAPLNFYVCKNLCAQQMHISYLQTKIVGSV
jgi:GR25 family glycosyltransferase involved in LPS biosynthesis